MFALTPARQTFLLFSCCRKIVQVHRCRRVLLNWEAVIEKNLVPRHCFCVHLFEIQWDGIYSIQVPLKSLRHSRGHIIGVTRRPWKIFSMVYGTLVQASNEYIGDPTSPSDESHSVAPV